MNTWLIITIVGVIIISGVISLFIALNDIKKKAILMSEYQKRLRSLYEGIASKSDCNEEMGFIVSESNKMSKIMGETTFHKPILELSSDIQYRCPISWIPNKIEIIDTDIIKRGAYYQDEHTKIRRQIWNPFTLFYRGIGLIMYIIFGYLISQMNTNFDFEGKVWKTINLTVALFGGIASIWQLIASFG